MAYITEGQIVDLLADKWKEDNKLVAKELVVPVIDQVYYDNFLEGREQVRIDLAAYDTVTDQVIFVEAENGLYLQHPQIYLPFCNILYILCPEDQSSFREEQFKWSKERGIGIIEVSKSGLLSYSLDPKIRQIFPKVQAFVKSRLFKRIKKESGKDSTITIKQ
ncbi:MAG: hypothetical protein H7645_03700 [Candidatus Heimdallarchaeota archaeon]|nr:hypothetical protein [Candidatus Heimdallarchaeota archaeon]MCK4769420.1 hypothetical protein [Candidatus Heimdallarchaeota archaeon]